MDMDEKLSVGFKIRFSLGEMAITMVRAVGDFYLLFYYTDVAKINPALVGSALLVGKLTWDAINDPLVGYLSDRTQSRFGRRRIYMLAGVVPWALAHWILYSLPQGLSGASAFWTVLLTYWLIDTFGTFAIVPYQALMAEVTHDYEERSSLGFYKSINAVIGYILGAAGVTLIVGFFRGLGFDTPTSWSAMGATYGVLVVVTFLVSAFSTKEQATSTKPKSIIPPIDGIKMCLKNRPFMILMLVFVLGNLAFTMQAALLPYLIQYQVGMLDQISIVMIASLATVAFFAYPAKLLADRINKGPAYAIGLLIASITFLLAFFLIPNKPSPLIYIAAVLLGVGFSAHWTIPYAMLPDVIEYDQLITGERREGIYYGISNFLNKFSVALGTAIPGWMLAFYGYVPNAIQTPRALFGIRLFYALIPAIIMFVTIPILFQYPITKNSHTAVREELSKVE